MEIVGAWSANTRTHLFDENEATRSVCEKLLSRFIGEKLIWNSLGIASKMAGFQQFSLNIC